MKKLLLSLSVLVILGLPNLSAQLINPDFETWSVDALAGAPVMDPNSGNGTSGWWDFNLFNSTLAGSSPVTVFKDSVNPSPESGSYCAKIITAAMSTTSYGLLTTYGFTYPQTNGLIITGYINAGLTVSVKTGIPVTASWTSFSFFYRYVPHGVDTCSCTIAMYHWDTTTHSRVLIGGAYWWNNATVTNWTSNTVTITYDTTLQADTAFILFSAASLYSNPQVGDTMNIDNGSYAVSSVNNINSDYNNITLYPNPANAELTMKAGWQKMVTKVEIYDVTGKLVNAYSMSNNSLTINTQAYSTGLYFYKTFDHSGNQLNVGKFSIVR